MKYKVIEEDFVEILVKEVNIAIADGWILQGGISVGGNGYKMHYCQAITKG